MLDTTNSLSLENVLRQIEDGSIRIPTFQRKFIWDIEKTLKLLDSIVKQFPIGTITFWETGVDFTFLRTIGDFDFSYSNSLSNQIWAVLDGQQRLTSIFACSKSLIVGEQNFKIFCDISRDPTSEDSIFATSGIDQKFSVSLENVLKRDYGEIYNKIPDYYRENFHKLRTAILNYPINATIILDVNIETITDIFDRINTQVTELNTIDIIVARTWSESFNLRTSINNFQKRIKRQLGTGWKFQDIVLLKSIACQLQGQCDKKNILSITRESLGHQSFIRASKNIKNTISFLKETCRVPSVKVLPYPSILITFSSIFHRIGFPPSDEMERLLLKYFWRVNFSSRYSKQTNERISTDLDLLCREELPNIEVDISEESIRTINFSLTSPLCKSLLLLYSAYNPQDIRNGTLIAIDHRLLNKRSRPHFHHFFPKRYLIGKGIPFEKANSIVNIVWSPAASNYAFGINPPGKYINWNLPNIYEILNTNLIGDKTDFGIQPEDFETFLTARSKWVFEKIKNLIELGHY